MKDHECQVGQIVICICPDPIYAGVIGTIHTVSRLIPNQSPYVSVAHYTIINSRNQMIGGCWIRLYDWDVYNALLTGFTVLSKKICFNCGYEHFAHTKVGQRCPIAGSALYSTTHVFCDKGSFYANLASKDIASPKPLSKECPCGITRVDCDYHK